MMRGKLITLEGLDGSGKGTQAALLEKALLERKIPLKKISFPDYSHPSSSLVKMYLNGDFGSRPGDVNAYAASSFYAVDRFASFRKYWKREFESGTWILADRYTTSNMVYQLTKLPQKEWDGFLSWVEDFEYGKLSLPRPDITVYLDMPPEISQELLRLRYKGDEGKKDIHESNLEYLIRCRESARYAAEKMGWRVIHCAKDGRPRPVEEIHREIKGAVLEDMHIYAGI